MYSLSLSLEGPRGTGWDLGISSSTDLALCVHLLDSELGSPGRKGRISRLWHKVSHILWHRFSWINLTFYPGPSFWPTLKTPQLEGFFTTDSALEGMLKKLTSPPKKINFSLA